MNSEVILIEYYFKWVKIFFSYCESQMGLEHIVSISF